MSGFIHLRVHSAYSLSEGALRIKELVKLCQKYEMPAVAVTDTNNLFGALEFASYMAEAGIQPIIGCQLSISRGGEVRQSGPPKAPDQLVVLVQNKTGYQNLMKISSKSFLETAGIMEPQVSIEDVAAHAEGLLCLTGGPSGTVARLIAEGQGDEAEKYLLRLHQLFPGRLYVELQRHGLVLEQKVEGPLIDLAYRHGIPLVATNDCFFSDESMYEAHDALLCIAQGVVLSETSRRKVTPEHRFKSGAEMRVTFADIPEAIDNTMVIARRCAFMPKKANPILPPFKSEAGRTEDEELRAQSLAGLAERLRINPVPDEKPYYDRLEFELKTIIQMGFPGYFLIVADFIKWAKASDIPVGPGRGSGAGSVVAWALTITDMDPLPFGLLFERFLNPDRVSMPDFDIDFCQDRRDEVITYVQQRYGREVVAQIITFGKLQARAVLRDVGRVLALPYGQIDRISKLVPNNPAKPVTLSDAIDADPQLEALVNAEESSQRLIHLAIKLEGLYRHASTHAGGVIISGRPLDEIVALYRDPRSDMPVTQFNFKDAEKVGLVKFDFLGLKTLTVIKHAIKLVARHEGVRIDLATLRLDDKKSYELMGRAETTGVFQVESAGMRDALRGMKPDRLEDIIALVALYRPGPMDNIPAYIAIKNGLQQTDYMHPLLEPVLKETYGIMVYQEQVMELARVLAGYSLGGADLLRRAMGKKIKAEMDAQRQVFVDGAVRNNVPAEQASQIFDKVAKFADYGFNKSHAAVYALVCYQTAYLKANHPHAFMAASMTYEMGDTDKLGIFRQELDRMGIRLLPPDVNKSEPTFAVEKLPDGTRAVRYALAAIKGVGAQAMDALVQAREEGGPFRDVFDFARRVDIRTMNRRQLEGLILAGAFDSLNDNRAQTVAGMDLILATGQSAQADAASGQGGLFDGDQAMQTPKLPAAKPWDPLTKLQKEFGAIGFFLSAHPLDQHKAILGRMGIVPSTELARRAGAGGATRYRVAGVVLSKQERMSKQGNRFAFIQLSDSSGMFEMTVFSEVLATQRQQLEPGRRILASVDVQVQESGLRLTCGTVEPLDEALARMQNGLQLRLESGEGLPKIAALLKDRHGGRSQVNLLIKLENGQDVEISLPGGFALSPEILAGIQATPGVAGLINH